jgi:glycosyltransferase involved in cell wall biosynthesis
MLAMRKQGHRVISLSQAEGSQIHEFLATQDIETFSFITNHSVSWIRHLTHLYFLIRFCWINKVQIVYSHLESANFIASMAQFFIQARVYICRHHGDQYKLLGHDQDLSYRITYKLSNNIIVVSDATKKYMVVHEKIPEKKIHKINLAYDFSLYPKVDPTVVEKISEKISAEIILVTAGNLTALKRPDLSIEVLRDILRLGFDAKLIILGTGELLTTLTQRADGFGISQKVMFPGYVENILEYLSAASFLVHPSISESSCVVVKEAGLAFTPIIACEEVGDFSDYIINGKSGFLVKNGDFVQSCVKIIVENFRNTKLLRNIGKNLNQSVHDHFSIQNIINHYDRLNE